MRRLITSRMAVLGLASAAASAVLVAGLSGASAGAGTAPRPAARASARLCASSYDPYQVTQSALRACGEDILPLRRVAPLPGGGARYDYGSYTLLVPPAHFNVLTASDQRLAEYGFPTRKRLGARWYPLMRHVRSFTRPTPYLVANPRVKANTNNPNWAGYNVNSHSYNGVSADWVEPSFVPAGCSGDRFLQWTGIGGINSGYLGQDGTTFNEPGFAAHQGFIETLNNDLSPPVAANISATPDQEYYSEAFWVAGQNHFYYYMENLANGATYNAVSRTVTADLTTAEVITERPYLVQSKSYTQLSDFQSVGVTAATGYWGSSSSNGFYSLSHNSETMVGQNSGPIIANPTPIVSGSDFIVYWDRCQG